MCTSNSTIKSVLNGTLEEQRELQRRWNKTVGAVVAGWILLGVVLNALTLCGIGVPRWNRIHAFTVGTLMTAVVAYSWHFTLTLTRAPSTGYRRLITILVILHGSLLVLMLQPEWNSASAFAALWAATLMLWNALSLAAVVRRAFINQLAATAWGYVLSFLLIVFAIALAMYAPYSGSFVNVIAAHSRTAVWGFAWLTVLSTVVTFLPTVTGARVSFVARDRCPEMLVAHAAAVTLAAIMLASGHYRVAGGIMMVGVAASVSIVQPTLAELAQARKSLGAAPAFVSGGMLWLLGAFAGDAISLVTGYGPGSMNTSFIVAVVGAGILQLITGALCHLLPVLSGKASLSGHLDRALLPRLAMVNAGGLVALLISPIVGGGATAIAVLWQLFLLLRLIRSSSMEANP